MTAEVDVSPAIEDLLGRHGDSAAEAILEDVLKRAFVRRTALVSSFGTEAAALLHMVAAIEPATPVLFVDTGRLFGETLRYRDRLVERLGLTDVRSLKPEPRIAAEDQDLMLFSRDADRCCYLRKVLPLRKALEGFDCWINGRKGHHGGGRAQMPVAEADGFLVKITPLARWGADDVDAYYETHDLPRHPLWEDGFPSVGCLPCTVRASAEDGFRAGRWAGAQKTECGIHLPVAEVLRRAGGC
ncbi:phosphoadenylyl-sulfate reductase [Rhodospirillum rubrum]|uniref:Adenosine 5'-phosphosulfate reductase n=1 Tax=Rhodospirillum rubrum (strain ATCC 11170 / ATH 1.1.1 / DSM 467 / LMG 4362 / NCIMB 8255 / S1) TaxID=269796 RepID=Q2RT16_RHORT|nr:phosphoadenylyl-sulfate reductase [Rhodospirillum rubrum]ABC22729.1 phosphoadenylylsulfate reductase (thioredoxin) [Rhodospirillum rubrum ATCC 11170]AEO48449.1 phosphoadenosine phosphosulfate reductase [Rhodospirillum rubrum F11]MBK5954327.1 phosphoadenosine phosphosulfate reductase [Rhodospirillum rubrum]QXG78721.1 phosphoadenylyl-sulfate reductase [Rhodospirillum rubrum]HAQ00525.1 phosphoadenylyl-sulfate reductase [Rhodospirillum rubrum]